MDLVESLYWECLRNIRENIIEILRIYEAKNINLKNLFAGFPPSVCESLLRMMAPDVPPEIILYFFRSGVKIIDLFSYQHQFQIQNIIEIWRGITNLNLAFARLSSENLTFLMEHLPNVIILNLCHTKTNDSVLKIIGMTCYKLENLNLSDCPITDRGLCFISYESKEKQKDCCKYLKVLSLYNTDVTAKGMLCVLNHHHLWEVHVDINVLMLAVYDFMKCHFDRQLNLRNLYLLPVESLLDLSDLLSRTLRIKSLFIYKSQLVDSDLINLPRFDHLKRLSLSVEKHEKNLTFEGIIRFLSISGKRLIELKLNNFEYVNLYFIGIHCRNLQFLSLYSIRHLYFRKKEFCSVNPLFNSLKFLTLHNLRGNPWDDCLLHLFMNSPKLNYLWLSSSSCFTKNIILEILPYLNTVKRLHLNNCRNITKETLHLIIDHLSNLKCLSLEFQEGILSTKDIHDINTKLKSKTSLIFHLHSNVNRNVSSERRSVNMEQMMMFFETFFGE